MDTPTHIRLSDLRGFQRLANDAVVGLADLVEAMHHTIVKTPGVFGASPQGRPRGITGLVYRSVRGITRLVGGGIDGLLAALAPLLAQRRSSREREAILAALNGVFGDYLVASANPLAIPMQLRISGTPLTLTRAGLAAAVAQPGPKLAVFVHGLCMNDLQWNRDGHDHGAAIAGDMGYTSVYLHYNSGLHISTNGRAFADLMETLVRAWPCKLDQLAIVGHSMGGLVARSACHYAERSGHTWRKRLSHLVFLGTPHFGAPLERLGTRVDYLIGISPYTAPFARLGKVRSSGIKDLGRANLRDDDWASDPPAGVRAERGSLALPAGVRCHGVAATKQKPPRDRRAGGRSGLGIPNNAKMRSDGLVPVNSALGRGRPDTPSLAFPVAHLYVDYDTSHFNLLSSAATYGQIRIWLGERPAGARRAAPGSG